VQADTADVSSGAEGISQRIKKYWAERRKAQAKVKAG